MPSKFLKRRGYIDGMPPSIFIAQERAKQKDREDKVFREHKMEKLLLSTQEDDHGTDAYRSRKSHK